MQYYLIFIAQYLLFFIILYDNISLSYHAKLIHQSSHNSFMYLPIIISQVCVEHHNWIVINLAQRSDVKSCCSFTRQSLTLHHNNLRAEYACSWSTLGMIAWRNAVIIYPTTPSSAFNPIPITMRLIWLLLFNQIINLKIIII